MGRTKKRKNLLQVFQTRGSNNNLLYRSRSIILCSGSCFYVNTIQTVLQVLRSSIYCKNLLLFVFCLSVDAIMPIISIWFSLSKAGESYINRINNWFLNISQWCCFVYIFFCWTCDYSPRTLRQCSRDYLFLRDPIRRKGCPGISVLKVEIYRIDFIERRS